MTSSPISVPSRGSLALHLLFFCSGASGLIYEVVWVREFGNVFGNTVYSASLVIAVFMCGLGVGSYVVGRWADRRGEPSDGSLVRVYGYLELAIALWGLGIAVALAHMGYVSSLISSYGRDPSGWYTLSAMSYGWRYLVAVCLMTPATFFMGGTLSLLIRETVAGRPESAGWRIATLYGVNTGGAALGCYLTDAVLVPVAGLHVAQLTAVLLNLIAAAGALKLAGRPAESFDPPVPEPRPDVRQKPALRSAVLPVALALGLSGFASMAMEILWFRHLSVLLGGFRAVFSLLLTIILVCMWLGATAGGWIQRRFGRPVLWLAVAQAVFAVSALAGLAGTDLAEIRGTERAWVAAMATAPGWLRAVVSVWLDLRPVVREVALPALVMGATFPLANAVIQRSRATVGTQAGALYLANTVGAVLGSLACGFVLLPFLGMQHTAALLGFAAGLAALPLAAVRQTPEAGVPASRRAIAHTLGASLVAWAAVAAWLVLPANSLLSRAQDLSEPGSRLLTMHEGVNEVLAVTEAPGGGRRLWTNGHSMSATNLLSQRYMRAFAHVPLLSLDHPERVLVICFGVGNTAHAASLHPSVRRLDLVDVSRDILGHAGYFAGTNGSVLADPRVSVYINDGRQHLRMRTTPAYDLITMEPPPITFAGVGSLYSREFYELVRARLTPGGYITQWLPAHQVPAGTGLGMIRAFVDVFPRAVLLSGAGSEFVLVGRNGGDLTIDPARVAARLRAAPAVQKDLDRVDAGTLTELVGMFVASGDALREATRDFPPATDDRPTQEYAARSRFVRGRMGISSDIFHLDQVSSWCPACFADGAPVPLVHGLKDYLAFLDHVYRDLNFAERGARAFEDPASRRALASSQYLQAIVKLALERTGTTP